MARFLIYGERIGASPLILCLMLLVMMQCFVIPHQNCTHLTAVFDFAPFYLPILAL